MKVQINVERQFNYYLSYDIDLRTTKDLSPTQHCKIVKAIKIIQGVFDPLIEDAIAKQKLEETK